MKRLNSLQLRLLSLVLGLVTAVWLGACLLAWFDAEHEVAELLDAHLSQGAALLVAQQVSDDEPERVSAAPSLHKYAPRVAFQVFHEGRLVVRSANASERPLATLTQGFATVRDVDAADWRVFAARGSEADVQVYVAEQLSSRAHILRAVLRSILGPLLLALPLLALAVWWAVHAGLTPLRQLRVLIAGRQPQALERMNLPDAPTEIAPVLQALNDLFSRIDRLLVAERRFAADAAHELRTPLAAIRAQAQVAQGAGADAPGRQHALASVLLGCDRAARLVEQLLTLARLGAVPPDLEPVDLGLLAQRVAAELAPFALARGQDLALHVPDKVACEVRAQAVLLEVLVRNLLDNALRYSPEGACVQVVLERTGGRVALVVEDSGPGLAEADTLQLGTRFFRAPGQTQPGSGLGWSIVRRIAEVSDAQVQLARSEALGGLAVRVSWQA